MQRSKTGAWIGGAVVVALLMTIASWFLLISPVLASAGETSLQAESTRQSNAALEIKVDRLAEQFTHLDEYKAQLADLRTQVPTDAELAAYLRRIDELAQASSVTVVDVSPGTPVAFLPVVTAPVTSGDSTVDATTEKVEGSEETTEEAPAPAPASAAPAGMVNVPLSMTVVGTYEHVLAFTNALQTTPGRLFVLNSFNGTAQKDAEASAGRPATAVGDLEISLSGFLYVLPDLQAAVAPVDPEAAPPALPAEVPGKNPLVPVG